MVGDHHVDAFGHLGEIALELADGHEHVDIAPIMLGGHGVHLADQPAQIATQLFDGVVDERLLARKLLEGDIEIAAGKFLDAGHRALLDRDMRLDQFVHRLRDHRKFARVICRAQCNVDIAARMFRQHMVHPGAQRLNRPVRGVEQFVDREQHRAPPAGGAHRVSPRRVVSPGQGTRDALDLFGGMVEMRTRLQGNIRTHGLILSLTCHGRIGGAALRRLGIEDG